MTDTIKEAGEDRRVVATLDRSRLWAIQTPQAFRRARPRAALDVPDDVLAAATDDAWLVERAGGTVRVVESPPANFKVTTPHDLEVAEMLLPPAMLTDYHVHLRPDEPDTPPARYFTAENAERYRVAAGEQGIEELGVSEHIYRFTAALDVWQHPFWRPWAVDDLDAYCEFVREETDLRLGIEADFIPGREDRIANLLDGREWDYVVGSVHFLRDYSLDTEDYTCGRAASRPTGCGGGTSTTLAESAAQRALRHHRPPGPGEGVGPRRAASRRATCAATTSRPWRRSRSRAWRSRCPPRGCASRSARSTRRGRTWRCSSTRAARSRSPATPTRPTQLGFRYEQALELLDSVGVREIAVFEGRDAADGADRVRTGIGIDSHAFAPGRRLVLGGVEIPFESGLLGHSDADVLAHAITDALLGAAGLGDIGQHFPDTDPRWKDADSMDLLRHVVGLVGRGRARRHDGDDGAAEAVAAPGRHPRLAARPRSGARST